MTHAKQTFLDLNRLGSKRQREAINSVLQLLETKEEQFKFVTFCAVNALLVLSDCLQHCACDDDGAPLSAEQARSQALMIVTEALGYAKKAGLP